MSFCFGNFFQDEVNNKTPIEWVPYRRIIVKDTNEPVQYDLISKNILMSSKPLNLVSYGCKYDWNFYKEIAKKEFFNAFETLNLKEAQKRTGYYDYINLPYFEDVFFAYDGNSKEKVFLKKQKTRNLTAANNMLETDITRWAANGNAFNLYIDPTDKTAEIKKLEYSMFSLSKTWQINVSGQEYQNVIKYDYNLGYYTYSEYKGIHGIRFCIILFDDQFPSLKEYELTTPEIFVRPQTQTKPETFEERIQATTKIHFTSTPQAEEKTINPNFIGPIQK